MQRINRISWVDYMKAFSILAVVLNHTHILPELKTAVYLVCLPAFFFVSGLFTNTQLTPIDFFKQKTLRLLIPYVIWGVLTWLSWLLIGRNYGSDTMAYPWWYPLYGMACGKVSLLVHNRPLWFLCCMISLEWIYYAICQVSKKSLRWILMIGIGIFGCFLSYRDQQWIWEISSAFVVLPIYGFAAEFNKQIKEKALSLEWPILLAIMLAALAAIWVGYSYNGDIKISECRIGNPILFYITAISVVGLWFSVALLIEKYANRLSGVLQYIGENTLLILCIHIPVFTVIKGISLLLHIQLDVYETTLGCFVLWIGAFLILLPIAYLINSYCPILVGKLPKKA